MAPAVLLLPGGLDLDRGWLGQRLGQADQQVLARPEVSCAGPHPLAGDELHGGGGGGPVVDVGPHAHPRAQRPAAQVDLDSAGTEVPVALDRAAQQALAQAQFAVAAAPSAWRRDPPFPPRWKLPPGWYKYLRLPPGLNEHPRLPLGRT